MKVCRFLSNTYNLKYDKILYIVNLDYEKDISVFMMAISFFSYKCSPEVTYPSGFIYSRNVMEIYGLN